MRELPATGLLSGVETLLYEGARYYTSVQVIIPTVYMSEAFFSWFYERRIKRQGDPPPQTLLLGFDSAPTVDFEEDRMEEARVAQG